MRCSALALGFALACTACGHGDATPAASTIEEAGVDAIAEAAPPEDTAPEDAVVADGSPEDAIGTDAADVTTEALDEDGVRMLHPTKSKGVVFRLGTADPNGFPNFEIEQGTKATKATEGGLAFWNVLSHPLSYASGGTGWTSRLHIYASGTKKQLYTWKTQKGWLATPEDPKDQELTVYLRAHEILDAKRAAFSLKVRGGSHSSSNGDLASCTMMVFAGPETSGVARFGKELVHPSYDYVKLAPEVATELTDATWVGLKLVTWKSAATKVHYELWIDRTPFEGGKPKNAWERFSQYDDVDGKDTGDYTLLADWGGMITTVRTDGLKSVDFALLSLREISAP